MKSLRILLGDGNLSIESDPSDNALSGQAKRPALIKKDIRMRKFIFIVDNIVEWISAILAVGVVIVCLLQIVFRFIIQAPLSWSEELSRYLFIWIVYIGGYLCTRSNSQLGITFFVDSMPKKIGRMVSIVAQLLVFFYQAVVVFFGFQLVSRFMNQPSSVLRCQMGVFYDAIPSGMSLMMLREIFNIVEHKSNRAEGTL